MILSKKSNRCSTMRSGQRVSRLICVLGSWIVISGCSPPALPRPAQQHSAEPSEAETQPVDTVNTPEIPPPPAAALGSFSEETTEALRVLFDLSVHGPRLDEAIEQLAATKDPRLGWLLADCLRFEMPAGNANQFAEAFVKLTQTTPLDNHNPWRSASNRLLAWDVPAPPEYLRWKRIVFEDVEPSWKYLFDDPQAELDWRHLTWGGVLMDERAIDATDQPCLRCIPALDHPAVVTAAEAEWPDAEVVFGLEFGDLHRAYPQRIMEVHEMVNDQLGDQHLALVYCTLCASAQVFNTDLISPEDRDLAESTSAAKFDCFELRTSGLLNRSNKLIYEYYTQSFVDMFSGRAISGPLRETGKTFRQSAVVRTTWRAWKNAFPGTTVLANQLPWGGTYAADPLQHRDDQGPIFPIGQPDDRLPPQRLVFGAALPDGTAVAFPIDAAQATLAAGRAVELAGYRVVQARGGLRIQTSEGQPVTSHTAFWFAWSQFHPGTKLWF